LRVIIFEKGCFQEKYKYQFRIFTGQPIKRYATSFPAGQSSKHKNPALPGNAGLK
jgi:hypothetical protein